MSIVGGRGFDKIVDGLAEQVAHLIREHQFSQKMATRLIRDAWEEVEKGRICREDPEEYIREHLDEQIKGYISLGVEDPTGFMEEEFVAALEPLVKKTVNFFAPPAGYPILDGELTCFLVPPALWGLSLRSLIGRLRITPSTLEGYGEVLKRISSGSQVTFEGHMIPETPYVLVGVKGGRGLRDYTRTDANKEREKFGLSYFSAYQFALLLHLRPDFLRPGESAIALGEKFSGERYLQFTACEKGFAPSLVLDPSGSSLAGIGKPYYARMITT